MSFDPERLDVTFVPSPLLPPVVEAGITHYLLRISAVHLHYLHHMLLVVLY